MADSLSYYYGSTEIWHKQKPAAHTKNCKREKKKNDRETANSYRIKKKINLFKQMMMV